MAKTLEELFDQFPFDLPQEIESEMEYKYFLREAKRLIRKGADQVDSIHAERLNALVSLLEFYKFNSVRKSLYKKDLEKRICVTLPNREIFDLKNLARRQRLTVTFLVREAINAHIKKYTE